jgi:hypothetical protein
MRYRNPGPKKKPRGIPFAKGNKLGGRKPLPADVKAAFEGMLPDAVEALQQIVKQRKHPRREQAAEYITNRVGGTPSSSVHLSGPNGEPLQSGPLQISVSFCNTPLSLGKAAVTHIGPDGNPIEVEPPLRDDQVDATPPQLRKDV